MYTLYTHTHIMATTVFPILELILSTSMETSKICRTNTTNHFENRENMLSSNRNTSKIESSSTNIHGIWVYTLCHTHQFTLYKRIIYIRGRDVKQQQQQQLKHKQITQLKHYYDYYSYYVLYTYYTYIEQKKKPSIS